MAHCPGETTGKYLAIAVAHHFGSCQTPRTAGMSVVMTTPKVPSVSRTVPTPPLPPQPPRAAPAARSAGGPAVISPQGGVTGPVGRGVFDPHMQPRPAAATPLDVALAKVLPDRLQADVTYLASDALGGRGTPSPGLDLAGRYVVDRLTAHGWQPGGPGGSYEYVYTLGGGWFDEHTALTIGGSDPHTLRYGDDFFFNAVGNPAPAAIPLANIPAAGIVYLPDGVPHAGQTAQIQTVATGGLGGQWLMVHDDGTPSDIRRDLALQAGARGVLVIPDPAVTPDPLLAKRFTSRLAEAKATGEVLQLPGAAIDEIMLTPAAASRLLASLQGGTAPTVTVQRSERQPAAAVQASNYVGFLPGTDPVLAKEIILVTAHLDHLGTRRGTIYNGADDNASGSAGLLALVEAVKALGLERSVMIMWVSGEEKGLLGSDAWARNPYVPDGHRVILNINADMIGRNPTDTLLLTPSRRHRSYGGLSKRVEKHAATEGITRLESADQYFNRSDQASFARHMGIPVVFITGGEHPDYHEPTDDPEKINREGLTRRTALLVRVLNDLREANLGL